MDKKGQGAIEYLLIIGAAILVVAVVIIALVSVTGAATDDTTGEEATAAQLLQSCIVSCGTTGGTWDYTNTICSLTAADWGNTDCVQYATPTP